MKTRTVYSKELGRIVKEVDVDCITNDIDGFLSVWDLDTLKRILATQLEQENYEVASVVQKHIDKKTEIQYGYHRKFS